MQEFTGQLEGGPVPNLQLPLLTVRPADAQPVADDFPNTVAGKASLSRAEQDYSKAVIAYNNATSARASKTGQYTQLTQLLVQALTDTFAAKLFATVPAAKSARDNNNPFALYEEVKKFAHSHDTGGCDAIRLIGALQRVTALAHMHDASDLVDTSKRIDDELKNLFRLLASFETKQTQDKFAAAVRCLTLDKGKYKAYRETEALKLSDKTAYDNTFPATMAQVVTAALQSVQVLGTDASHKRKNEDQHPKVQYGRAPTGPNSALCSNCGKQGHSADVCWSTGGGGEHAPNRPANWGQGGDRGGEDSSRGGGRGGRGRGQGRGAAGRGGKGDGGRGRGRGRGRGDGKVPPGSTRSQFQGTPKGASVRVVLDEPTSDVKDAAHTSEEERQKSENHIEWDLREHDTNFGLVRVTSATEHLALGIATEHPTCTSTPVLMDTIRTRVLTVTKRTLVRIGLVLAALVMLAGITLLATTSATTHTSYHVHESAHSLVRSPYTYDGIPTTTVELKPYAGTYIPPLTTQVVRQDAFNEYLREQHAYCNSSIGICIGTTLMLIATTVYKTRRRNDVKHPRAFPARLAVTTPRVNTGAARASSAFHETHLDCGAQVTIFEKNEPRLDYHRKCEGVVEGIGGTQAFHHEAYSHKFQCWGVWDKKGTLPNSLLCMSTIEEAYELQEVKLVDTQVPGSGLTKSKLKYMVYKNREARTQKQVFERMFDGPNKDLLILLKECPAELQDEDWFDEWEEEVPVRVE